MTDWGDTVAKAEAGNEIETNSGRRQYDRSMLASHPASAIVPASAELQAKVDAAGWPEGLLDRVLAVRPDRGMIDAWLESGFPNPEHIEMWALDEQRWLDSTALVRTATWADHEMLSDLCANAPEKVGDWRVTVERSPNPFAQYRLQERANVLVLEDQRVALAMSAASVRNTYIEGERTSAHFMSGWRVRDGFRGLGLAGRLQNSAGSGTSWFGLVSYWYVRLNNASASWIQRIEDDMENRPGDYSIEVENLTATVWQFACDGGTDGPQGESSVRVRAVHEDDLDRCVELINRTHQGLDLFRPYSQEYLRERLDDPCWGPKPSFYDSIYGWPEYRVIEADGQVVACGGLWDRGRDVREVWERLPGESESGSGLAADSGRFVSDPTALLDFGFAEGHEGDMAELISHFVAESRELGRVGMLAAVEFLPALREATAELKSTADARELHVMPFTMPDLKIELAVTRPYTDLAYW